MKSATSFLNHTTFHLIDIYRSLDYFARYSESLQKYLHEQVCKIIGRDGKLGYYDVTNYYFQIPYNDEDEYDNDGKLIREKSPPKEQRPDPIVQMSLLIDSNGIPMAFNTFSGAESEKTSLLPTIRRVKRDYGMERIIVVADRGLNTSDNTAFLTEINNDDSHGHDGYVYGQSVLNADSEFKAWVLEPKGYINTTETDKYGDEVIFRHKSRIYVKNVQLQNRQGKRNLKMTIYQKQMVYYSENIKFVKETGEIPDGVNLSLNLEKIAEEEKYDGYYSIVTSEKICLTRQSVTSTKDYGK